MNIDQKLMLDISTYFKNTNILADEKATLEELEKAADVNDNLFPLT